MQVADMGIVEKMLYIENIFLSERTLRAIDYPDKSAPEPTPIRLEHIIIPSIILASGVFCASALLLTEMSMLI